MSESDKDVPLSLLAVVATLLVTTHLHNHFPNPKSNTQKFCMCRPHNPIFWQ